MNSLASINRENREPDKVLDAFSDTPEAITKFIELLQWKYNPDTVRRIPTFEKNIHELEKIFILTKWELEMLLARNWPMVSINNGEYDKIKSTIKTLLEGNREEWKDKG